MISKSEQDKLLDGLKAKRTVLLPVDESLDSSGYLIDDIIMAYNTSCKKGTFAKINNSHYYFIDITHFTIRKSVFSMVLCAIFQILSYTFIISSIFTLNNLINSV